jgi:hypothetical protein
MITQDTQIIHRTKHELDAIISKITVYQKPFIRKMLRQMSLAENENTTILCDYIIAEQNEFNIKESTKEGKIKCLVRLSKFLKGKSYRISLFRVTTYCYWFLKCLSTVIARSEYYLFLSSIFINIYPGNIHIISISSHSCSN